MNIPDAWNTLACAWVGRSKGRTTWAVATPEGVLRAEALDDDADLGAAAEKVLRYLSNELNTLGVDFHTNHAPLRDVLADPALLAAAGLRVSHVTVLEANQMPSGDTTLTAAQTAAEAAAADRGPVYLRAATDGGRYRKGRRAATAQGGYGWLRVDGRFGFGPLESTCALESELVAIEKLLAATDATQPLLVEVDSRAAIAHAKAALAGLEHPEKATKATAAVLSRIRGYAGREVSFHWVKGHNEVALNEAAHELARLGRRGLDLYGTSDMVSQIADRMVRTAIEEDRHGLATSAAS